MGLLRGKATELSSEIKRLANDARKFEEDRHNFAIYEKK
jgi:hypothetical protein